MWLSPSSLFYENILKYSSYPKKYSLWAMSGSDLLKLSYTICDYIISARSKGSCPDAYKDWIK